MKTIISLLCTILAVALLPCAPVDSATLLVPQQWKYKKGEWGLFPVPGSATTPVEMPDSYFNTPAYMNGMNYSFLLAQDAGLYPDDGFPFLGSNGSSSSEVIGKLWNQNPIMWQRPGTPVTCMYISFHRWRQSASWMSSCIPITLVGQTCRLSEGAVLLDHGIVGEDDIPRTTTMVHVKCDLASNGRLRLDTGGDTIPIGGGQSKLTADGTSLSASRKFLKGENSIEVSSTLTGVAAGAWSASSVLTLDLD